MAFPTPNPHDFYNKNIHLQLLEDLEDKFVVFRTDVKRHYKDFKNEILRILQEDKN